MDNLLVTSLDALMNNNNQVRIQAEQYFLNQQPKHIIRKLTHFIKHTLNTNYFALSCIIIRNILKKNYRTLETADLYVLECELLEVLYFSKQQYQVNQIIYTIAQLCQKFFPKTYIIQNLFQNLFSNDNMTQDNIHRVYSLLFLLNKCIKSIYKLKYKEYWLIYTLNQQKEKLINCNESLTYNFRINPDLLIDLYTQFIKLCKMVSIVLATNIISLVLLTQAIQKIYKIQQNPKIINIKKQVNQFYQINKYLIAVEQKLLLNVDQEMQVLEFLERHYLSQPDKNKSQILSASILLNFCLCHLSHQYIKQMAQNNFCYQLQLATSLMYYGNVLEKPYIFKIVKWITEMITIQQEKSDKLRSILMDVLMVYWVYHEQQVLVEAIKQIVQPSLIFVPSPNQVQIKRKQSLYFLFSGFFKFLKQEIEFKSTFNNILIKQLQLPYPQLKISIFFIIRNYINDTFYLQNSMIKDILGTINKVVRENNVDVILAAMRCIQPLLNKLIPNKNPQLKTLLLDIFKITSISDCQQKITFYQILEPIIKKLYHFYKQQFNYFIKGQLERQVAQNQSHKNMVLLNLVRILPHPITIQFGENIHNIVSNFIEIYWKKLDDLAVQQQLKQVIYADLVQVNKSHSVKFQNQYLQFLIQNVIDQLIDQDQEYNIIYEIIIGCRNKKELTIIIYKKLQRLLQLQVTEKIIQIVQILYIINHQLDQQFAKDIFRKLSLQSNPQFYLRILSRISSSNYKYLMVDKNIYQKNNLKEFRNYYSFKLLSHIIIGFIQQTIPNESLSLVIQLQERKTPSINQVDIQFSKLNVLNFHINQHIFILIQCLKNILKQEFESHWILKHNPEIIKKNSQLISYLEKDLANFSASRIKQRIRRCLQYYGISESIEFKE